MNVVNATINSDLLPPFPSIIYPEGRIKFYVFVESFVDFKKKMVNALTTKAYGIAYNKDMFKSVKEVSG